MSTVVVKEPYRLGNLDFARYFDHAIGVILDRFRPIAIAFLCIAIPPLLVYYLVDLAFGFSLALDYGEEELMDPEYMLDFWFRGFGMTMAFTFLYQIMMVPMYAAIVYLVGMHYLGTEVSMRASFRFILPRLFAIVVANVAYNIAVTVGMMFCIVPGVLLAVWFYLYIPVMIFEQAGPFAAFGRSRDLVSQGEFLRIFFVFLALGFLGTQMGLISMILPSPELEFMFSSFSGALLQAFTAALVTIIYFSLRAKHESLDLEILASQIDLDSAAESPAL